MTVTSTTMAEALINPELIKWARERASIPIDALATKLKIKVEKLIAWEAGEANPTFKQAEKFAKCLHIPFGFLFLPKPPEDELAIPDFRTKAGAPKRPLSTEFLDLLRDVTFQHDWYRDYLIDIGAEPKGYVGKFANKQRTLEISEDIRGTLNFYPGRIQSKNWEAHLSELFDRCEDIGIWVMRTGYVGSNTKRTLEVSEFRGFAIADDIAPIIFINGRDAKAAQAFTLAHELAHLWLGKSGVSNPRLNHENDDDAEIEKLCNAIAADVLVPADWFENVWDRRRSLEENTYAMSLICKVSQVVIARRARDLGKISWATYHDFFEQEKRKWPQPGEGGGGNFYNTAPVKNGRRFTRAVISQAMAGSIPLRDAGTLLHMKPNTVKKLHAKQSQEK